MTNELNDYEKLIEATHQLAANVKVYYEALLSNGLDKETALFLSAEYQDSLLNVARKRKDGDNDKR